MNEAEFATMRGWSPGTILDGSPIGQPGEAGYEPAKQMLITAIGEEHVLARFRKLDGTDRWGSEGSVTFSSRRWQRHMLTGVGDPARAAAEADCE